MFDNCIYFNTTALARLLEREWTAAFKPFDLTPAQGFMLRVILDKPGSLPREIAETMVISRPTATRALDGLAAKGLIERHGSDQDGREWLIYPTPAAEALHSALNSASGQVTRRLKRVLGEDVFSSTVLQIHDIRSTLS